MRTVIFIFLIILLLSTTVMANSMSRFTQMSVDGEIDYLSRMGGNAGETVLQIKGEGIIEAEISSSFSPDSFSYELEGQSEGLEIVSGVKLYTGDIYVSKLTGETEFEYDYYALINTFPTINVSTENYIMGSLERKIDMKANGMWIDERFSMLGALWVLDQITFTPENAE